MRALMEARNDIKSLHPNNYEKIMDINVTSLEMGYGGVFVDFVSSDYINTASTNLTSFAWDSTVPVINHCRSFFGLMFDHFSLFWCPVICLYFNI